MMLQLLGRRQRRGATVSPIGLDVNPTSIRAAQLQRAGDRWKVLRVSCWERREAESESTVSEGLAHRVRRSMEQLQYRRGPVVAGISAPEVEFHPLEIPDRGELRSAGKFEEAVRWELERVMSFTGQRVVTTHWRVPPSKATRTTAIGVAGLSSIVDYASAMAGAVGCECERVDATACALSRLGSVLSAEARAAADKQAVWGVLDIGARLSRMVVCLQETPVLVRTLGSGGRSWTEQIAESLGLSVDAAELHKWDHGIRAVGQDGDSQDPPDTSAEIAAMIFKVIHAEIELLAVEVERSYEYVLRCYPEAQAAGLLLVGGGADLRGLKELLTGKLGVQVQRLHDAMSAPGAALVAAPTLCESLSPYACALGLAITPEEAS